MFSACASVDVMAMTTASQTTFIAPPPHIACNEAKSIGAG
jgi:hypothetical protein